MTCSIVVYFCCIFAVVSSFRLTLHSDYTKRRYGFGQRLPVLQAEPVLTENLHRQEIYDHPGNRYDEENANAEKRANKSCTISFVQPTAQPQSVVHQAKSVSNAHSEPPEVGDNVNEKKRTRKSSSHPQSAEARAKISAANKGKIPWNLNRHHSAETRRKIAESTLRYVYKKKLEKATAIGLTTVEQYEAYLKEEKRKLKRAKQAEMTEIRRQRMSEIMKLRWQDPAVRAKYNSSRSIPMKPREPNLALVENSRFNETEKRRVPHFDEWRTKISTTLKKRWEDPEFRQRMIGGLQRRHGEWRTALSQSIKAKWMEPEYRDKVSQRIRVSIQARSQEKQRHGGTSAKSVQSSRNHTSVDAEEQRAKNEEGKRQKEEEKKRKEMMKKAKEEKKVRLALVKSKVAAGEVKAEELQEMMGEELWEEEKKRRKCKINGTLASDEDLAQQLLMAWTPRKSKKASMASRKAAASGERKETTTKAYRASDDDDDPEDMAADDESDDEVEDDLSWQEDSVVEIYDDHGNFAGVMNYMEFLERRRRGEYS
eukprot:gene33286-40269_t